MKISIEKTEKMFMKNKNIGGHFNRNYNTQ